MSYTPSYSAPIASPHPAPAYYPSTPPAPPPKPSGPPTPARGPPLPPPPGQAQSGPSELDGNQSYQFHSQQQYRQQDQGPPQANIPPIEAGWLPDVVKEKTTSDLHLLLTNPALQSALLSNPSTTHPSLTTSTSLLPPLLQTNIALTHTLQTLQTRLASKQAQTQSRLLALRALEQQHRAKLAETEKALEQFSPRALYLRLAASVLEQELLVRGVEESWLEDAAGGVAGEREVEVFVRRVREARKVGFLRRERRGRWDEGRVGGWR